MSDYRASQPNILQLEPRDISALGNCSDLCSHQGH